MGRRLASFLTALFAFLFAGLVACPAYALPAFARRYRTGCATCHVQFPKLNEFGEAFRRNGYRYPGGDDAALKQAPLTLVADARRDLFPESDWPTDIAETVPLAVFFNGAVPFYPDAALRPSGDKVVSLDTLAGRATAVVAGRAGRHISFFGGVALDAQAGAQFERVFLTYSNEIGDAVLTARVGQFDPQVLSFSSYRIIAGPAYWMLTNPPTHAVWTLEPYVRGLGFSGMFKGRVGVDIAYVQGVEGAYDGASIKQVPRDLYAHVYGRLGGLRLDGAERVEQVERADESTRPSTTSLQIGAFVYGGEHDVATGHDNPSTETDIVYKIGGDVVMNTSKLQLLVAWAFEHHHFEIAPSSHRLQALAEASYRVFPWLVGTLRGESEASPSDGRRRFVPIISVLPRLNVKAFTYASFEQRDSLAGGVHVAEIDIGGSYAF